MLPQVLVFALSSGVVAEPAEKRTLAFTIGAAIDVVTFAVGVALVGSDRPGFDQARAGWVTCSAGFTVGPFVAHAMTGQWVRGAVFSAVPLAATIGNAVVLGSSSQTIDVTPLNQDQRLVVVFTSVGILASVISLVDVLLFKPHAVHVTPTLSQNGGGFVLGGSF